MPLVVDAEGRLDVLVAACMPELSRSRAAALIKEGCVRVNGRPATRASLKLSPGDTLEVEVPPPAPAEAVPQDLPLAIVYEDADLVVVNKAAGMVVHPAAGHADGTLVNALLHHVGGLSGIGGVERPGIVHRLDKGTSGLLVVAKGDTAHRALAEQFADHSAGRDYLALCLGVPDAETGTIRNHLARHPNDRMRYSACPADRGKPAVTHWTRLAFAGPISLIGCRLETGRTHQVRVHLSESGWPLVGDPQYGRRNTRLPDALRELVDPERPLLHAWQLRLTHPRTGEALTFHAPAPADLCAALDAVGIPHDALPEPAR